MNLWETFYLIVKYFYPTNNFNKTKISKNSKISNGYKLINNLNRHGKINSYICSVSRINDLYFILMLVFKLPLYFYIILLL